MSGFGEASFASVWLAGRGWFRSGKPGSGLAGKVGSGCVSYGELSSGLLRYGMAGKARLG